MDKPEALRLADLLESCPLAVGDAQQAVATAELRRLHQFSEDQIGRATAAEAALQMTKATHALKIAAVEAQRDALLEQRDELRRALEIIAVGDATNPQAQAAEELIALGYWRDIPEARAAIRAVEKTK